MQKPTRTLIFGLNYPPETTGISPYTGAMASGLLRNGDSVRVITAHPHYPEWKIAPGYGRWSMEEIVKGVPVRRLRHFVPRRPTPLARALSELSLGLRQSLTRWGRPDAIVAVSPALLSSVLVRLRRAVTHRHTPFIVWVQDLYGLGIQETGQGGGIAARAVAAIERWLLRSATGVVVIHDRFADRVRSDFALSNEAIHVIRNWTHLQPLPHVDVNAVRSEYGWGADEVVVVHTGNMGVKQGLHHVVDAGRLAHRRGIPVRFVLVGNGSQRDEIERRIAESPTKTELLPPLDDDAFAAILLSANVLLVNELPGVAEMAVPSKLTSYFASGRPILAATDSSGITAQEVRAAQAGVCVDAGDPSALLHGALDIARHPELADQLGQNGKRYRDTVLDETFAVERFGSLLSDLTTSAAEKRPAKPKTS